MNKNNPRRNLFIDSVDWISIVNDQISFDELVLLIEKNSNIVFNKKSSFDHNYLVISKDSYFEFFDYYESFLKNYCRFTRIDIKFDFRQEFEDFDKYFGDSFDWKNAISEKDGFHTFYFNSRKSDVFCRLYDKQRELDLDFPLSRLEYEIKGSVALMFSARYRVFGFNDALDYLYKTLFRFNNEKGLDSIICNFDYDQPIPYKIIENSEKKQRLLKFLKQYRHSIIDYVDWIGTEKFFELCHDLSNFDEVIERG